jgi:hypothetical protein
MSALTSRLLPRSELLYLLIATTIAVGACSAASKASSSPQPTASPAPSATPAAVASTASSATPDTGPADFATWVEIQGFGGSSGLNEVLKAAKWTQEHPAEGNAFDIEGDMRLVANLAEWLDDHAATPCWSDYHQTMRASLDRIHEGFAAAAEARAASRIVPQEVAAQLVAVSQAAYDLPKPEGC